MPSAHGIKTEHSLSTVDMVGIRAIFFDAVGTLIYPVEAVATTYRLAALRQSVDLDVSTIRLRLREAFSKQEWIDRESGWRTNEMREIERWRTIVRETLHETPHPDDILFELWEWFRKPTAWKAHPETAQVLMELNRRGFVLGMASNFDARLAEIVSAKSELEPIAERLIISSLIGWRKPSREFFSHVLENAGHRAEQILYVGDDLRNDYEGALAAGMRALLLAPDSKADGCEVIQTLSHLTTGQDR